MPRIRPCSNLQGQGALLTPMNYSPRKYAYLTTRDLLTARDNSHERGDSPSNPPEDRRVAAAIRVLRPGHLQLRALHQPGATSTRKCPCLTEQSGKEMSCHPSAHSSSVFSTIHTPAIAGMKTTRNEAVWS